MTLDYARTLLHMGMSPTVAERKAELFQRAATHLAAWAVQHTDTSIRCFVPGRIEVLGKHTDYAGGRSLLCAVERGICAVAAPREDSVIRMADVLRNQESEFEISTDLDVRSDHWPIYPRTVARRLARNFPGPLRGIDVAFGSDLPRASGMSSSSALLICTWLMLARRNELERRPEYQSNIRGSEELAAYLGCVENGQTFGTLAGDAGVGTFGGSEDHTAILCSRPGILRQYAFCPTRLEAESSLPAGHVFLIAVCGVTADKTGAAREQYNRASATAREILNLWRIATGRTDASLFEAVTYHAHALDHIREAVLKSPASGYPRQVLIDRLEQFSEESMRIIPEATDALKAGDLESFGRRVGRSQALAEQKLGNQIPQTIALTRSARELGAIAASAFGAGFGGSVWAMTHASDAARFLTKWEEGYRNTFPIEAGKSTFFVSGAGPAAMVF